MSPQFLAPDDVVEVVAVNVTLNFHHVGFDSVDWMNGLRTGDQRHFHRITRITVSQKYPRMIELWLINGISTAHYALVADPGIVTTEFQLLGVIKKERMSAWLCCFPRKRITQWRMCAIAEDLQVLIIVLLGDITSFHYTVCPKCWFLSVD